MPNKKISELTLREPLTGEELFEVAIGGVNYKAAVPLLLRKKVTVTSAQLLTLGTSPVTLIA